MEKIEIQKIDGSGYQKKPNLLVKVSEMGNITEIQYMEKRNNKQIIQMIDKDTYLILATGELLKCNHIENRSQGKKSLYRTFANARALINTNVVDVENVRWCTLTYKENMTDTKRLYDDFKKFNLRFQYHLKKNNICQAEYIVMMEPQGRGAWHCHLLYIWDCKAPFIPNNIFADIWGHGFVKIKKLDNVDNVGAYLTAYLGDMEIQDAISNKVLNINSNGNIICDGVKEIEIDGKKKAFIKGARLNLYPSKFNMIRYSKGIKKPIVDMVSQEMAEKKVKGATMTYSSCLTLFDEKTNFKNVIIKDYYNSARK